MHVDSAETTRKRSGRRGGAIERYGERAESASTRDSDLFSALSEEEIETLDSSGSLGRAARAEALFQEGRQLAHLYLVCAGSFKLVQSSEEGREFIVDLAGRGDTVGALAEPTSATVSARALEDSIYLALPVASVRHALDRNPKLALRAVAIAERRRAIAETRAVRLAFESVPRRLTRLLLDATDRRTGVFRFPLNQSELASFIGSSRETVCSILNRLRRDGVIESIEGRIHVLDRKRLESATSA